MQPWGFAVSCLLQHLVFWPWRVCRRPACRFTLGGGGALLGLTVLFLRLGGLLFLIYIPPSRTIHWKTICKVFKDSFPLDWCHSVAVRHSSPQMSNK